jgi:hypothetical protein
MTFTNEGVTLRGNEIELSFLKPNPECAMCDVVDDYVCFFCEVDQVQDQTTAILTDCYMGRNYRGDHSMSKIMNDDGS